MPALSMTMDDPLEDFSRRDIVLNGMAPVNRQRADSRSRGEGAARKLACPVPAGLPLAKQCVCCFCQSRCQRIGAHKLKCPRASTA